MLDLPLELIQPQTNELCGAELFVFSFNPTTFTSVPQVQALTDITIGLMKVFSTVCPSEVVSPASKYRIQFHNDFLCRLCVVFSYLGSNLHSDVLHRFLVRKTVTEELVSVSHTSLLNKMESQKIKSYFSFCDLCLFR